MSIINERLKNLPKNMQAYILERKNYCNYWHIPFNILQQIDFYENLENDGIPF